MILSNSTKAYCAIAGSFILALSLGNFYTLGNLSPYLTSYLRLKVQPWFTDSYMIWINGFFMLGDGTLMPLGGLLAPIFGSRIVLAVGCFIFSGFWAFSAFTLTKGFIPFCITYGFLSWIGAGIISSIIIGEVMKWFPARKGLVSSMVVSGFGFGGFALNAFQTAMVNPDNLLPDKSGNYTGYFSNENLLERVPEVFWQSALLMAILQVLGIAFLFTPPNNSERESIISPEFPSFRYTEESPYQPNVIDDTSSVNPAVDHSRDVTEPSKACLRTAGLHPKELFASREFYLIWGIFACHMIPVSYLLTYYKNYGLTFIDDDHYLSTIGAVGSFVSCFGKIAFGIILDRTSYKLCLALLSAGISVSVELLYFAQFVEPSGTMGKGYFTAFFFLGYICVGGIYGIVAGVSGAAFGLRYAGANFGIMFSSQAVGSFAGAFLVQALAAELKWTWASFTSVTAFSVLSFILCLLLRTTPSRTKGKSLQQPFQS